MADAYVGTQPASEESTTREAGDARLKEEQEADVKLAETLSGTIEDANERVVPIVDKIREVRFSLFIYFSFGANWRDKIRKSRSSRLRSLKIGARGSSLKSYALSSRAPRRSSTRPMVPSAVPVLILSRPNAFESRHSETCPIILLSLMSNDSLRHSRW